MISNRAENIVPSATIELSARVGELRRQGQNVIAFNVGEPDFPPPDNVCQAAAAAVANHFSKYTAADGTLELRQAICAKLKRDNGLDYAPDEVCASAGAKQALQNALLALCNDGDEVILPTPCWVSYAEMIKLAGAVPVFVPLRSKDGFLLDTDAIARAVTPRTKAVLICTPNNPTGAVYSEESLRTLVRLACEKDFYIIADEIYEKLIYDGYRHVSAASFGPQAKERVITVNGFSKAYAMPGWRLGYTACSGEIAAAIRAIQGHMTSAPCSITQKAGTEALNGPQDAVEMMRREYERRRDYAFRTLSEMPGIELAVPHGAFYLFPKVTGLFGRSCGRTVIHDARDLTSFLLDEARIAVVFGEAFYGPGYIRLSYAASMDAIREGLQRMGDALSKLN